MTHRNSVTSDDTAPSSGVTTSDATSSGVDAASNRTTSTNSDTASDAIVSDATTDGNSGASVEAAATEASVTKTAVTKTAVTITAATPVDVSVTRGVSGRGVWRNVFAEAWASLGQNPARTLLTMMGTIVGVGAFVTVLGLTATASGQISSEFSILQATLVQVNDAGDSGGADTVYSFPPEPEQRVLAINGVEAAGVRYTIDRGAASISSSLDPRVSSWNIPVQVVTHGYLAVLQPTYSAGAAFTQFEQDEHVPVVVLGLVAARQLGITDAGGIVYIDGAPYHVAGILASVQRNSDALSSVLVPATIGWDAFGPPSRYTPATMMIQTRIGAAQQVASQVAVALRPDAPSVMAVVPPPDPPRMQSTISSSMQGLFFALAGVTLLIGAAAIANTTLVSVMERVSEIGLRRAVGAAPRHIIVQFLTETILTGTVAGLTGASLAVLVVIGVALGNNWTALIDPWVIALGPILGASVGLLSGLYPAWKAGHTDPIQALRR